ncbi:MAG: DUF3299 domain-containing protein [Pseudomonadota bacterium]
MAAGGEARLGRRALLGGGAAALAALGFGAFGAARWFGGAAAEGEAGARRLLWPDLRPPVDASAFHARFAARLRGEEVDLSAIGQGPPPSAAGTSMGAPGAAALGGLVTAQHYPSPPADPLGAGLTAADWVDGRALDTSPAADAPFAWDQEPARKEDLVGDLHGERIALPGYAVPLDLEADGTRLFLLAPYVGACIHVPPPPPNQIVLVTAANPYWFETMFEAIVVTGLMRVEPTQSRLAEVGYQIEADLIRPFDPEGEGLEWLNG